MGCVDSLQQLLGLSVPFELLKVSGNCVGDRFLKSVLWAIEATLTTIH